MRQQAFRSQRSELRVRTTAHLAQSVLVLPAQIQVVFFENRLVDGHRTALSPTPMTSRYTL